MSHQGNAWYEGGSYVFNAFNLNVFCTCVRLEFFIDFPQREQRMTHESSNPSDRLAWYIDHSLINTFFAIYATQYVDLCPRITWAVLNFAYIYISFFFKLSWILIDIRFDSYNTARYRSEAFHRSLRISRSETKCRWIGCQSSGLTTR